MRRQALTLLALLSLLPALSGCGNGLDKSVVVADNYDLGRQNIVQVSARQRTALVSLFNSGVPIKAVRWPSNAVIGLYANQDLWKGIGAPLPSKYAKRYGADDAMKRSAWNVYRISVARGLDKPLIDRYFNSPMGRREIRGNYLINLANNCYKSEGKIPASIKIDARRIFDTGGSVKFICPKNPSIRAHSIR